MGFFQKLGFKSIRKVDRQAELIKTISTLGIQVNRDLNILKKLLEILERVNLTKPELQEEVNVITALFKCLNLIKEDKFKLKSNLILFKQQTHDYLNDAGLKNRPKFQEACNTINILMTKESILIDETIKDLADCINIFADLKKRFGKELKNKKGEFKENFYHESMSYYVKIIERLKKHIEFANEVSGFLASINSLYVRPSVMNIVVNLDRGINNNDYVMLDSNFFRKIYELGTDKDIVVNDVFSNVDVVHVPTIVFRELTGGNNRFDGALVPRAFVFKLFDYLEKKGVVVNLVDIESGLDVALVETDIRREWECLPASAYKSWRDFRRGADFYMVAFMMLNAGTHNFVVVSGDADLNIIQSRNRPFPVGVVVDVVHTFRLAA